MVHDDDHDENYQGFGDGDGGEEKTMIVIMIDHNGWRDEAMEGL